MHYSTTTKYVKYLLLLLLLLLLVLALFSVQCPWSQDSYVSKSWSSDYDALLDILSWSISIKILKAFNWFVM